jgi:signal transduction histidine kinase
LKTPQFSIRTTLLAIISLLNVLIAILVGSDVYESWGRLQNARALSRGSVNINLLYAAEKYLSLERAASVSVIYTKTDTAKGLQEDIVKDRTAFESAFARALPPVEKEGGEAGALALKARQQVQELGALRAALDENMKKPLAERDVGLSDRFFDASTTLVTTIRDLIAAYARPLRPIDAIVSRQMTFKLVVWEITEYAGREYAVIGRLIAENRSVTPERQKKLITWRGLIEHGWETARATAMDSRLDKKLAPAMDEAATHYFMAFDQIKDLFYNPATFSENANYPLSLEMWLSLASQAVDSLLALKDLSLAETQNYINGLESDARRDILIHIMFFAVSMGISLYCLGIIVRRVIAPINAMVDTLYKATRDEPYEPPANIQRHDEIGKLAAVLSVFQDKTIQIKQSNEELERYAYITAHDLKSPLCAIDNLSQWIEEDIGDKMTPETKKHMDTLRSRVRRMEKLLNDTLEYSRIGRKMREGEAEVVNGKALVEDAVTMAAPPTGFTIKVDDGFSGISLRRMPVQQVFYNLVNNAIKHHDGETGTIEIGVQDEGAHYVFSVRDDGPGIAPQYHEKVFEMFQTLKPRDRQEGSGMGLAIVRKILMTSGGTIKLESEAGKGCLFRFTWPKETSDSKLNPNLEKERKT